MTTVTDAIARNRYYDRPAFHAQTLVIKHKFRIGNGNNLFLTLLLSFLEFGFNGGYAFVHLGTKLINPAFLGIVLALSLVNAGLSSRKLVHHGELIIFSGLEFMGDKIDLNRILLIFLVGLQSRLRGLKLLNTLFQRLGFFFVRFDSTSDIVKIRFCGMKICGNSRKPRRLKSLAARKILQFQFKLTDSSIDILQLNQSLYNSHDLFPFWGRRRDSNPQPTESQSVDLTIDLLPP